MKNTISRAIFKLAIWLFKLGFRILGDRDIFSGYDMAIISKAMKDGYIKSEKKLTLWKYRSLRIQIQVVNRRIQKLHKLLSE